MKHIHAGPETCDRTPYADCDGSSQKVPSIPPLYSPTIINYSLTMNYNQSMQGDNNYLQGMQGENGPSTYFNVPHLDQLGMSDL